MTELVNFNLTIAVPPPLESAAQAWMDGWWSDKDFRYEAGDQNPQDLEMAYEQYDATLTGEPGARRLWVHHGDWEIGNVIGAADLIQDFIKHVMPEKAVVLTWSECTGPRYGGGAVGITKDDMHWMKVEDVSRVLIERGTPLDDIIVS